MPERLAAHRGAAKLVEAEDLATSLALRRRAGARLVLCHGCFDLLHIGHVRHFAQAKAMGELLVVSLTADEFINKGPDRPYFPLDLRMEFVAALEMVDFVVPIREPTGLTAIETLRPDVYVKGPDYAEVETSDFAKERATVEMLGGKVAFTSTELTNSSTALLRLLD